MVIGNKRHLLSHRWFRTIGGAACATKESSLGLVFEFYIVKNTFWKNNFEIFHPDQFLCKNRICRGFRLFCQCQFWNETSIIYFSWLTCSIWRESEGVLVKKIPRGPPGGAQSTPGALCGKKFCLQKWGPNNSECFDLPRSTIIKNTFLKKWNFSSRSIFMQK